MPLIYTCKTTIDLPRDRVIELLDNVDNLPKWLPGLIEFRHLSGTPGHEGAVSLIRQKMGKGEIEMTETITKRSLPEQFDAVYEAKGVWNRVDNTFTETPEGHTHWQIETEFRCRGFTWLMCTLAPGLFRRETRKYMGNFKEFAESA